MKTGLNEEEVADFYNVDITVIDKAIRNNPKKFPNITTIKNEGVLLKKFSIEQILLLATLLPSDEAHQTTLEIIEDAIEKYMPD